MLSSKAPVSYRALIVAEFLYYAGGIFKLELFLPEEYPMAAPKVTPVTISSSHPPLSNQIYAHRAFMPSFVRYGCSRTFSITVTILLAELAVQDH